MDQTKSKTEPVSRSARIGTKFLIGYIPFTGLSVLFIVLLISNSRSWEALLAGGVFITVWSIQVAITNLLIVFLRFNARFLSKAFAVSTASILLLPLFGVAQYQLNWLVIGKPDIPAYVEQTSASRCKIVRIESKSRMKREYSYAVNATIQCADESRARACKWIFWYDKINKQWKESLSLSLTCVPREL